MQRLHKEKTKQKTQQKTKLKPDAQFPMWVTEKNLAALIHGEPSNPSHKLAKAFVLEGDVNIACLQAAVSALPKHHPVLRSYYKNGVRYQQSLEKSDSTIRHHDLTNMKNKPTENQILNKIKTIISQDIDIANAPLFAFDLIKVSDQKSILISQVSHMLCDGFSAGILFYELSALYNSLLKVNFINEISRRVRCGELGTQLALPILAMFVPGGAFLPAKSYAEFVTTQKEKAINDVELLGEDFHQFTPKERKSFDTSAKSASNCGIVTHEFSQDFNEVTPFVAKEKCDSNISKLLLATLMLTAEEVNEGSCSVRVPYHNRHNKDFKLTVGYLASNKVAEVKRKPNMTFKAYLNAINQELHKKYNRHHMPACALLTQNNKSLPFLEFNFLDKKFTVELDGLKVTPHGSLQDDSVKKTWHGKGHYESELSFFFNLADDKLTLTVYYLTDAYDETYVNQFVEHFMENFQSVLLHPEATIEEILSNKNHKQDSVDLKQLSGYNAHQQQQQAKTESAKPSNNLWGSLFKTVSDHPYYSAAVTATAAGVVASQMFRRS